MGYSDFWDKKVIDKPIQTNYGSQTNYAAGLGLKNTALNTAPKLSYMDFINKMNTGAIGGGTAPSFPTSQPMQTNYGKMLSSYSMPTQSAPKTNYGGVDLDGGTNYGGHIDLYGGTIDTQKQQMLNQVEVNRQLGKATYGVTAEKLGQANLTGSGYAQFLDAKNEANAIEARRAIEQGAVEAKTTFQTENGQLVQFKNAQEISEGIDSGMINSISTLNTIKGSGVISDEEYKALTDRVQGKTYQTVAETLTTELEKITGTDQKSENAKNALLSQLDDLVERGELSQSHKEQFFYDDIMSDYKSGEYSIDQVFGAIENQKEQLGTRYETIKSDIAKSMTEKSKSTAHITAHASMKKGIKQYGSQAERLNWGLGYNLKTDGAVFGESGIAETRVVMGFKGIHDNSDIVKNADIGQVFIKNGVTYLKADKDNYLLEVNGSPSVQKIYDWYKYTDYNLG